MFYNISKLHNQLSYHEFAVIFFGCETASMLLMSKFEFDITKEQTFSKFITQYNDRVYQSGITELSYAAERDKGIILLYHWSTETHGVQ